MNKIFSHKFNGKWILCGEHSVLRGGEALVFPIEKKFLKVDYNISWEESFKVDFGGTCSKEMELLFWGVYEKAIEYLKIDKNNIKAHIKIDSFLPIGMGLGASAALCICIAYFFYYKEFLSKEDIFNFSKNLENLFHGKSSGVDIAACLYKKGIVFKDKKVKEFINLDYNPKLFLSYCGQRGITAECVYKVNDFCKKNPTLSREIDKNMLHSVELAKQALIKKDNKSNTDRNNNNNDNKNENKEEKDLKLIQAINLAYDCFAEWGLINSNLKEHIELLKKFGAKTAKPTGSGLGGFVISLWDEEPPNEISSNLIKCF